MYFNKFLCILISFYVYLGVTTACFEPSLDYCVVKIPRLTFVEINSIEL